MYRPIKAVINAAALCFQENVKLHANDKQTAGIKLLAKSEEPPKTKHKGQKSVIALLTMLFL